MYAHLLVSNLLVKRAPVVHQKGIALDVLNVGPRALVGFVALIIVYCHLQHKQRHQSSAFPKIKRQLVTSAPCCSGCQSAHNSTTSGWISREISANVYYPNSWTNPTEFSSKGHHPEQICHFEWTFTCNYLSMYLLSYWVIHRSQLTNFILHENYRLLFDSPQSYIWGCYVAVCTRLYGHHWTPSYTALQSSECWSHLLSVSLLGYRTCTT